MQVVANNLPFQSNRIDTINCIKKNRLLLTNVSDLQSCSSQQLQFDEHQRCLNENPFENAYQENLRIEAKLEEKNLRKKIFETNLRQRLKAYEEAKYQLARDSELKVQTTNQLSFGNNQNKQNALFSSLSKHYNNSATKIKAERLIIT
jgi:hypothetical protein